MQQGGKKIATVKVMRKSVVLVGVLLFLIVAVVGFYAGRLSGISLQPIDPNNPPCTLEARICPDGSSVGRTGPNCEFSPCPNAK